MKRIVIIPSRYGSTRFEGKPLVRIAGKPMIQWVYERCQSAAAINAAVVATDDMRIVDAVKHFGGKSHMTAPEHKSGTDRIAQVADDMGLSDKDIVVNVQGDQPLVDPRSIDDVVTPFLSDPDLKISTLAFKIVRQDEITNPKDVKVTFDNRGFALYFSRAPIPLGRDVGQQYDTYKHLGVYAYTVGFLKTFRQLSRGRLERIEKLEQLRALEHGFGIKVVVTRYDSPEVDLPSDIERIEQLMTT